MNRTIDFSMLKTANLIKDAIYCSGPRGRLGDEPISKILKGGNRGGFRYSGTIKSFKIRYVILYSTLVDPDWPDQIDNQNRHFVYFGDNKKPGHNLFDTRRKGNLLLFKSFQLLESGNRSQIPPFFIFTKHNNKRDVMFRGLAVPGSLEFDLSKDLQIVKRKKGDSEFENYRAVFTILNDDFISRTWIDDLNQGKVLTANTPKAYWEWINA